MCVLVADSLVQGCLNALCLQYSTWSGLFTYTGQVVALASRAQSNTAVDWRDVICSKHG